MAREPLIAAPPGRIVHRSSLAAARRLSVGCSSRFSRMPRASGLAAWLASSRAQTSPAFRRATPARGAGTCHRASSAGLSVRRAAEQSRLQSCACRCGWRCGLPFEKHRKSLAKHGRDRDFASREILELGARHTIAQVAPLILPARPLGAGAPIPYYLAAKSRTRRPVKAGTVITLDDLDIGIGG